MYPLNIVGTVTAGGKPLRTAQLQYLQQQTLARKMNVFHHQPQQSQQLQQQAAAQGTGAGAASPVGVAKVPVSVATIQVTGPQQRSQITAQVIANFTRTVS